MEAVKFDFDKSRFHVHRLENGVVEFFGSLTDTTEFSMLDDVLTEGSVCDFGKVEFASWLGISGLITYIKARNFNLVARNLPYQFFDTIKLFKEFHSHFKIESGSIGYFSDSNLKVEYEIFNFEEIKDLFETKLNHGKVKGDKRLLYPIEFILDIFRNKADINLKSQSLLDNQSEINFWLRYIAFVQNTIEVSSILVNTAEINMLMILDSLKAKMECGEQALKVLEPNTTYTLSVRLEGIQADIQKGYRDLFDEFEKEFGECQKSLCHFTQCISNPDITPTTVKSNLREYATTIKTLRNVARICEDYGSSIGKHISSLRATHVLKSRFTTLSEIEPKQLEKVRSAFAIMDVMSEDSWEETRPLIMKEIDECELLVGKAVVTLQVFDLVRQIIEHRITEATSILEALNHHKDWTDESLINELKKQVSEYMVTDQEKHCFEFFLPEGFEEYGDIERKEPGDVLLF